MELYVFRIEYTIVHGPSRFNEISGSELIYFWGF